MSASLLIRCAQSEAENIKDRARQERRSVNAHVLNILARALSFEATHGLPYLIPDRSRLKGPSSYTRPIGPRAVLFLRCTAGEAERIRKAAAIRQIPVNEYVLTRLARSYEVQERFKREQNLKAAHTHRPLTRR